MPPPAATNEVVVDTYLHRLNSPLSCHLFTLNEKDEGKVEEHMNKAPQWKLVFPDQSEIIPDDFQSYMIGQQYLKDKGPNETQFEIKLLLLNDSPWNEVLPFAPLFPDRYHRFKNLDYHGISTHLLYMHYPNGGIHSLKAFGLEQT